MLLYIEPTIIYQGYPFGHVVQVGAPEGPEAQALA